MTKNNDVIQSWPPPKGVGSLRLRGGAEGYAKEGSGAGSRAGASQPATQASAGAYHQLSFDLRYLRLRDYPGPSPER